ncbi:MAG TPA: flagellinolysin [Symbiobacteriaceae bacterium]|nr:flagellinolysin [Symbiobacteriaceae bacterium]
MRIRSNWTSLVAWRAFSGAANQMDRTIGSLSSGLRVSRASDDAAGMSISERLRSQFQSLAQANRNVMDGISLVQTAESSLQEITNLLQRARELAVQSANGTLSTSDKKSIQVEANGIIAEVDRIVDAATFNGRRLLSPSSNSAASLSNVISGLRTGWLEQSEQVIQNVYGLTADGSTLSIVLHTSGVTSAWITGTANGGTGHLDNLALHINLADFGTSEGPDGGTGPLYNDRKVARALTQAILARTTHYAALGEWFISGAADYVAGRNEQLAADISAHGATAVVNALSDAALGGTWVDDSIHRSAAYAAMRFLDQALTANGFTMADFMQQLAGGATVDSLLTFMYGNDLNQFVDDFVNVFGVGFVTGLALTGPDVGGIGGGDAVAVIPNGTTYSEQPLAHFTADWSSVVSPDMLKPIDFTLQVGANVGDTVGFQLPVMNAMTLDLLGLDYVGKAMEALERVSSAMTIVNGARSTLGGISNRLEHTLSVNRTTSEELTASYSRIRDLDFARSLSNMTRQQILVSSSGAMLAQANTVRQNVKWLLNGLSSTAS